MRAPELSKLAGEARMMKQEVRERTGFPILGVPPFPRLDGAVVPDVSLTRFRTVWGAAGPPDGVLQIAPDDIVRPAGAGPTDVTEQL